MSVEEEGVELPAGSRTAAEGTPVPVDLTRDRRWRLLWVVFLGGPVIWFAHFMLVYLVAEAGCTGGGDGLEVFDAPVPYVTTVVATAVACLACLAVAWWARRWWRDSRDGVLEAELAADGTEGADAPYEVRTLGAVAVAGGLLAVLSAISVLFVGIPALVFTGC